MLRILFGPMYAGKTTRLCSLIERASLADRETAVVRHVIDNRFSSDTMCTHANHSFDMKLVRTDTLSTVRTVLDKLDVIGIDEGQFYPDLKQEVLYHMSRGKEVIIASLDGDKDQVPFQSVLSLIPYATQVEKLTAICESCKNREACTTVTTTSDNSSRIQVGGKSMYSARCFYCIKCHISYVNSE